MSAAALDIAGPGGERFTGYLSLPTKGSGPGLVLPPEIFGVNRALRAAADFFAEEGHVVLVPDLFWRLQPPLNQACACNFPFTFGR
jgi:carboxymethylenebutenolidase